MPAAQELVAVRGGGWVTVVSGRVLLARFDDGDLGMRNTTIVSLRNAGFGGKQVAAAFGLTANSVSLLRRRARLEGSAGLVREMGRPSKISGAGEATAARMAAKGATQQQIAARLGVDRSTVSRLLARIVTPEPELDPEPEQLELIDEHNVELDGDDGGGGGAEGGEHEVELMVGVRSCRYAGAALGLAFLDRIGFAGLFRGPGPPGVRLDSTAIATGTTLGLLLGASNLEGFKHLAHRDLGALVGIGRFASQRTLRARVAALGDTLDAIGLQTRLAKALLDLDRPAIEVFFVDDHFVTYSGGAPLGKGWNTKRRHAEPGHSDTWLADASGRPLICMSGEPTGLTAGLIQILQPLRHIVGDPARPLVAFDRGGSYPTAFKALHTAGFDWVAYRRGALTATTATPKRSWSQLEGTRRHYTAGDETIDLAGYGPARQITLYEHGDPAAQILTSVHAAVPAPILYLLRCRWRIENTFKYLAEHHGIDSLCDYTKTVHTITRDIPNPQRATATTAVAAAETAVRDAKTRFADLIWQPWTDPITHLKVGISPSGGRVVMKLDGTAVPTRRVECS